MLYVIMLYVMLCNLYNIDMKVLLLCILQSNTNVILHVETQNEFVKSPDKYLIFLISLKNSFI